MPYVESWNHLVPISYYRGKDAVKFVDVFDPEQQAKLEAGVKANCFRSRKNPTRSDTVGPISVLGRW